MPQYVVFANSIGFPSSGTTYFITADNLDAAINQAAIAYPLTGAYRVDRLSNDLHIYDVAVDVVSRKITVIDP